MARCDRKTAEQYEDWRDFRLRRSDPIWQAQRWSDGDWLWPCEGQEIEQAKNLHVQELRDLLRVAVQMVSGIVRNEWDICWIRAPIALKTAAVSRCWRVYKSDSTNEYFAVWTEGAGFLEYTAERGGNLGALSGQSWVYRLKEGMQSTTDRVQ